MVVDPQLTNNALAIMRKRYLAKNENQEVVETPRDRYENIAVAVAQGDQKLANRFYQLMAHGRFLPNSPTIANAGKTGSSGQLSACFVVPVDDSMEGIFQVGLYAMAAIHKTGGGTGFSFSRLRPAGDSVKTSGGVASGPVSFMQVYDAATEHVKQGGMRRGANMGVLRVDHPDIVQFIKLKQDPERLQNFNVSVGITNAFLAALERDGEYDLINPRNKLAVGQLRAKDVWQLIIECAHGIGDPGLVFLDRINEIDPLSDVLGPIEATNPCGEVPLRPWDACTLGSINLSKFVIEKASVRTFDWDALSTAVDDAVMFLNGVLDINVYPLVNIAEMTHKSRKIGLGVMGWADSLFMLGIPYASAMSQRLAAEVMEFISTRAVSMSETLAETHGPFPAWKGCRWDLRGDRPRRNSTCTVIAPTGTISIFAGCSSGIEPMFALSMTREQADMRMTEVNPLIEAIAKREGFYSDTLMEVIRQTGSIQTAPGVPDRWRDVFRVANEISVEDHIRMQAAFQLHTEDGVSKTINMANSATLADVEAAYMLAWSLGCKGITIYRDGCRSGQVLTAGVVPAAGPTTSPFRDDVGPVVYAQRGIPDNGIRQGYTLTRSTPFGKVHATINEHPSDKDPFEVFVELGKSGSEIKAFTEALGRTVTYLLGIPSPVKPRDRLLEVARQLASIGGGGQSGMGPNKVVSAPDAIAKVFLNYLYNLPGAETAVPTTHKPGIDVCPECGGATLVSEGGCETCHSCGFSRC